jgi:hypothetical protein
VNWFLKDVRINAVYFRDEMLIPISQKLQTNGSGEHRPWPPVHMDNAQTSTAKVISSVVPDLRVKRTAQLPYSPDVCPSDFFLFGWLKGKLQHQQFTCADQLFEAVDEIFSPFSIDMIEDMFRNWIHRLVQVIAQMVTTGGLIYYGHRRFCAISDAAAVTG